MIMGNKIDSSDAFNSISKETALIDEIAKKDVGRDLTDYEHMEAYLHTIATDIRLIREAVLWKLGLKEDKFLEEEE